MITFSRISSPDVLTKTWMLDKASEPVKRNGAQLYRGQAERVVVASIAEFVAVIATLTPEQAITFGITEHETVALASAKRLRDQPDSTANAITRSRRNFHWSRGGSIMFLDYDPRDGRPLLDAAGLRDQLVAIVPALVDAPMAITASASSHVHRNDTGELVAGPKGLHVYIHVEHGSDIERAGRALYERTWLAGHGFFEAQPSGRASEYSLIDKSVFQPERLDFANGAACIAPLVQRRPDAIVWNADASAFDSRAIDSLTKVERAEIERLTGKAKAAISGACDANRKLCLDACTDEDSRAALRSALDDNRLGPQFILFPDDGGSVTVAELLSNPAKWHDVEFADPIDTDYRNDSRIAVAKLIGVSRPYVFSHAHGGIRYALVRQPVVVEVVAGEEPAAAEQCLAALAAEGLTYRYGDSPAQVLAGKLVPLDFDYFSMEIARNVAFVRRVRDPEEDGRGTLRRVSMPPTIAKFAFARAKRADELPLIRGVITAPTIRADGTILDEPGFSTRDGLFYAADEDAPRIPERPTREQVRAALELLKRPFAKFPFEDDIALAAMLAAVLTAPIRSAINLAPLIHVTAPVAGTGKTKVACMLATLAGDDPAVSGPPAGDEEAHKVIVSTFRSGRRALVWDNYDSDIEGRSLAVLGSALTYSGRTLGRSEDVAYPNTLLVVTTGNNVKPLGDLCRRTMTISMDPKCENPNEIEFDFEPVHLVADARPRYVAAALVVLRGFLCHGQPVKCAAFGGFEVWDRLVRQTVLWTGREFPEVWGAGDPFASVQTNVADDDTKTALRRCKDAMTAAFGKEWKSAKEIIQATTAIAEGSDAQRLRAWIDDLQSGTIRADVAIVIGRYLAANKKRVIDGYVLATVKRRDDVRLYRWVPVGEADTSSETIVAPLETRRDDLLDAFAFTAETPTQALAPSEDWLADPPEAVTPSSESGSTCFNVTAYQRKRAPLIADATKVGDAIDDNGSGLRITTTNPARLARIAAKHRATLTPTTIQ